MKRITLLLVVSHVALTTVAAIPERSFSMIREGKGYLQKGTPAEWVERYVKDWRLELPKRPFMDE